MPNTHPLLKAPSFGPDTLRVLGDSFDGAWQMIAGNFADDQVDAARTKLAKIMLELAGDGQLSMGQLTRTALRLMREKAGVSDR